MPTNDFSPLFQPIKIGKLNLKNRIVMAPMCSRLPTADGEVTQALIDHYEARAKGGASMLIIEFAHIGDDCIPGSFGIEDACELALMLEEAGIDAHHVSGSIGESWEEC